MANNIKLSALDLKYLQLLAQSFPNISEASTEIINLQAILNLPKGTEHFLADVHGEYEAFQHILKNASGNIQRKVSELFGNTMREADLKELCTLIYYPDQKLELIKASEPNINDWYHITIHQLVSVCRLVSSKYTRSKVRKALPKDFSYIGTSARAYRRCQQNRLCKCYYRHHHHYWSCRRFHYCHIQCNTASGYRPASYPWRHLRPRTGSPHHHGHSVAVSFVGYTVGQPRHPLDGCLGWQPCLPVQCYTSVAALCQPHNT